MSNSHLFCVHEVVNTHINSSKFICWVDNIVDHAETTTTKNNFQDASILCMNVMEVLSL